MSYDLTNVIILHLFVHTFYLVIFVVQGTRREKVDIADVDVAMG
jgi:hypothetical protein